MGIGRSGGQADGRIGRRVDSGREELTTFSFPGFSGSNSNSSSSSSERYISDSEIAAHLKSGGGWVIIHGEVYDIQSIAANVPGTADKLMESIGKDATKAFEMAAHSDSTKERMRQYIVGKYKEVGMVCWQWVWSVRSGCGLLAVSIADSQRGCINRAHNKGH